MKNTFAIALSALMLSLYVSSAKSADDLGPGIVAVPQTVEPMRIPNAKPRNVVFILSDDHRFARPVVLQS